jgi:hypothetical protein
MIEIIVAVILQITTILGGDSEKVKAEQKAKEEKAKTEQKSSEADGGQGNWE